eukprot:TRINITY_DN3406_c0_g1_i1.p1 TRINITY_DN3406_c0_g1~~TRINITY_DN3406_c0_g1_i1.p1  ORF type:complete len:128 (-),score=21.23 TRINITY_DN3406_c0_g1_i1:208-564(-)
MATEILNANAEDLDNHNINFGLNALSKNAYRISKLTQKSSRNQNLLKKKIVNPLTASTLVSTPSIFRGLTRNNSFLRDLEVTKDYQRDESTSGSSDDAKFEGKEEEHVGRGTNHRTKR